MPQLGESVTEGTVGRWLKAVGLIQDCDTRKRQELALIEAQRAAESAGEALFAENEFGHRYQCGLCALAEDGAARSEE